LLSVIPDSDKDIEHKEGETMKRWTSTWAAVLVAGFLAVPGTGLAQTPPAPAASATTPLDKAEQGTPQEYLQKADAALNSISPTAVSGTAKAQIAELKKHVNALEKISASEPAGAAASPTGEKADTKSAASWTKEAAAADKILGELLTDAPAAAAPSATPPTEPAEPRPTGTSGTMPPSAAAATPLDEETKAKLKIARSSLTAFAAAMSGSAKEPPASSAEPAGAPSATMSRSESMIAQSTTAPAEQAAPASQQPAPSSQQPPAEPTQSPAPPPTEPTQPPTSAAQPPADPAAGAQSKVDGEAAKRALTAARESLAQMTQLPAAQQLTGETRTQVSQLISSFNDLITTNSDWKATYSKVDTNLTALIGPQSGAESTTAPTAGAAAAAGTAGAPGAPATGAPATAGTAGTAGAAGAVGTGGTTTNTLDPGIKAKLVEFRTHLKEFEKAAGGSQK
jgi:hypothetical protein